MSWMPLPHASRESSPAPSRRLRTGFGLVEIMVGLAVLAAGLFPVFQMMSGTRGMLAQSQEMLLLQGASLASFEQAREQIRAGAMMELEPGDEEMVQTEWAGVSTSVSVLREEGRDVFRVRSHSAAGKRFFVLEGVVADPTASYTPAMEGTP